MFNDDDENEQELLVYSDQPVEQHRSMHKARTKRGIWYDPNRGSPTHGCNFGNDIGGANLSWYLKPDPQ